MNLLHQSLTEQDLRLSVPAILQLNAVFLDDTPPVLLFYQIGQHGVHWHQCSHSAENSLVMFDCGAVEMLIEIFVVPPPEDATCCELLETLLNAL